MLWTILIAILILGLLIALFKIFHIAWKFLWGVVSAIVILSIFLSIIFVLDARDFSQKFQESEKLFLLEDNNHIITGISGKFDNSSFNTFTDEEINEFEKLYQQKKFSEIIKKDEMLFIVSLDAFNETEITNEKITTTEVKEILKSDNPKKLYEQKMNAEITEYGEDQEFKGTLFALLFGNSMEQNNFFLIQKINEKQIIVYPASPIIFILKNSPAKIISKIMQAKGYFKK